MASSLLQALLAFLRQIDYSKGRLMRSVDAACTWPTRDRVVQQEIAVLPGLAFNLSTCSALDPGR